MHVLYMYDVQKPKFIKINVFHVRFKAVTVFCFTCERYMDNSIQQYVLSIITGVHLKWSIHRDQHSFNQILSSYYELLYSIWIETQILWYTIQILTTAAFFYYQICSLNSIFMFIY